MLDIDRNQVTTNIIDEPIDNNRAFYRYKKFTTNKCLKYIDCDRI